MTRQEIYEKLTSESAKMIEERTSPFALENPQSVLAKIGNTPLIRIQSFTKHVRAVEIYGKEEWFNPGGLSRTDRP